MRYQNIRRRFKRFLHTVFHSRQTLTEPSAVPHTALGNRPSLSISNASYHTNDIHNPRAPSAGPRHDPSVLLGPNTGFIAIPAEPSGTGTQARFHPIDHPDAGNHNTRGPIVFHTRTTTSIYDLAQTPMEDGELRLAGCIVDATEFASTLASLHAIWDDFDAADVGGSLFRFTRSLCCC